MKGSYRNGIGICEKCGMAYMAKAPEPGRPYVCSGCRNKKDKPRVNHGLEYVYDEVMKKVRTRT